MAATARRPLVVVPIETTESDDEATQLLIDAQREIGIRASIGFLLIGDRGRAHREIVRSVHRQVKVAFGGEYPIEPSRTPLGGGRR